MKKNKMGRHYTRSFLIKVMKCYIILFFISIAKLFSSSMYAQNLTLNFENAKLKSVLDDIETKSEFSFFYNNNLIDNSQNVSINVKEKSLAEVLILLFKETNIDFKFLKNQIVLFPKGNTPVPEQLPDLVYASSEIEENNESPGSTSEQWEQNQVNGTVLDEDGLPIPGANVLLQGSEVGVVTDMDGNFTLKANEGDILEVSYIGFETVEVTATAEPMTITLKISLDQLEEVIVTGYGSQRKSRVTGSALNMNIEAINGVPRAAVQESLQGNIAGVLVTASSGQPGNTPSVRIRGVGSFDSSSPLYVIDGFQTTDEEVMVSLNPSDIQQITVLKDAAATSIYGTRGANGVIVIQTKSGVSGKTEVSYSTQSGLSSATVAERFKPLNTYELQELLVEGVLNANIRDNNADALEYLENNGFNPNVNTNWYDLLTREGLYQQHDLSIRGGSEKTRFYISGGYFNQEAIIKASSLERLNSRIKVDHSFNDKLNVGVNLSYNKHISHERPNAGALANPVRAIYRTRPDISPYNEDGTYNFDFNSTHNPLAQAEEEKRKYITHRILAGANLNYNFAKGLSFESMINMNQAFLDNTIRLPSGFGSGRPVGRGEQDTDFLFTWLFRNLLKYELNWNDHYLTAFAGYELQKTRNKETDLTVENIPDGFEDLINGSLPTTASTEKIQSGLNSVFVNAEYAYADKYLISGSVRRDGSSSFGDNNKYGVFWSVGLGWNMAKEGFMDDVEFISDLKFRFSYGANGNDPVSGIFNLYSINDYNNNPGIYFSALGNPNIKWEVNNPLNFGLDYSFLEGRIQGSFDWYKRETRDLLRARPISATNGDTSIAENIGAMENSGMEFNVITRNIINQDNGFNWTTSLNITTNKNKVTKLTGNDEPIVTPTSITKVGEDYETFYLPMYAGVDPANGNALWYTDESRSEVTAVFSNASPGIIGKATPDFYAGLRNSFSYRGVTLDFQLYTAWGGMVYDTWERYNSSDGSRRLSDMGNVTRGTYERRWQKPGDITDVPAFVYGNTQTGSISQSSSRFVYDGSFIRLREVSLSYNLPLSAIESIGLSKARVYVKGNNLYTYIKDDRLERDPEAGYDGRLDQEIPITKTIFLGLDITF